MKFRTALYNVRGLGSAKDGTHHWWMQRVTAVALVPLTLWLCVSLARVGSMEYADAVAWLGSPLAAVLMLATLWALFFHARLGMQVVVEDYVRSKGLKVSLLMLVNFVVILLGLGAALAVLRISLGG